jgi:hypothetical protein
MLSGQAHLLQCDLDSIRSASVVVGKVARVNQVFAAEEPNCGCQVRQRLLWDPGGGSAEGSRNATASIFSPIENCFFSKT